MYAPGRVIPPIHTDYTGCFVAGCIFAVVGFILLIAATTLFTFNPFNGTGGGGFILVVTSPIWGTLLFAIIKIVAAVSKPPAQQQILDDMQYVENEETYRQQLAAWRAQDAPDYEEYRETPLAVLGAPSIGTLAWCYGHYFTIPEPELSKHMIVIGGSGTGKTVSLMRIAYLAAAIYGYRVHYIDAKGDRDTAAQFLCNMRNAGITARMFPRQIFNGFKGDSTALLNRLMAVVDFSEPYYEDMTQDVLYTVLNDQKRGVPHNSRDLLQRLNMLLAIDPKNKGIEGVILRYRSFFNAVAGSLDNGFSWEDTQASYILLDGLSLKKQAASLGRFLLEDFAHYAVSRKQKGKDLLIVDEYSALSTGADAANLVERIRSYGCSVILSSQSYAALGEPRDADRILAAANILMLHRCDAPDQLAARAGRQERMQQVVQYGGNIDAQIVGGGRAQTIDDHSLHPDYVRRLQVGEAITISHGLFTKAQVTPAPPIDPKMLQKARAWIDQPAQALPPQHGPQMGNTGQPGTPLTLPDPATTTRPHRTPPPQQTQPNVYPHPPELL
jgi:hypothetical protein